jgi:hypothetical protein
MCLVGQGCQFSLRIKRSYINFNSLLWGDKYTPLKFNIFCHTIRVKWRKLTKTVSDNVKV